MDGSPVVNWIFMIIGVITIALATYMFATRGFQLITLGVMIIGVAGFVKHSGEIVWRHYEDTNNRKQRLDRLQDN